MYCTKCGKKLQEGEICTCEQDKEIKNTFKDSKEVFRNSGETFKDSKEVEWMKERGGETAKKVKSGFLGIVHIWRSPVTVTRKWVEEDVKKNGLKYMIAKAAIMLIFVFGMAAYLSSQLGMMSSYISLPYFSFVIITLLLTIGADLLETGILHVLGRAFGGKAKKNAMFSVVGIRATYDLTIIVVTMLLAFMIEGKALYVGGALLLLEFYVEFASYSIAIDMNENRKIYAYFLAKLVTLGIIGAISCNMIENLIEMLSELTRFF